MGSIEIPEVERRVLPNCDFLWKQEVVNQSPKILSKCATLPDVETFLGECEHRIRNIPLGCKVIWNHHVQSFGGDEFGYIIYFYSEKLGVPIRAAFSIDPLEQKVVVGNMDVATPKEEKKLRKEFPPYLEEVDDEERVK